MIDRVAQRVALPVLALVVLAAGAVEAQARPLLTIACKPSGKTTCAVVISLAGDFPTEALVVTFPGKGYRLDRIQPSSSNAVYVLGPPASNPSNYKLGGAEYVSKISSATSDPTKNRPGAHLTLVFALPTAPAPTVTASPASSPALSKGSYAGTCGKDATGAKPCQVSFALSAGGKEITNFRFEPPACLVNNNTTSTLPVAPDGSFNITITFNSGTPKFTFSGRIESATKATVKISASCNGKTTTRTANLTKR